VHVAPQLMPVGVDVTVPVHSGVTLSAKLAPLLKSYANPELQPPRGMLPTKSMFVV